MIYVGWVSEPNVCHVIPVDETLSDAEAAADLAAHAHHRECFCYPHKSEGKDGWEGWTMWHHSQKVPSTAS